MAHMEVVALCDQYDLKAYFGRFFSEFHPELKLVAPEEVTDPERIRHGFAFAPGPKAFDAYPNLKMVSSAGAGVDGLLRNPSLRPEITVSRIIVPQQGEMIAGFALWHIVGWQRDMAAYGQQQKAAVWKDVNRTAPGEMPVAVLGLGAIGQKLVQALQLLGYPVMGYGSRERIWNGISVRAGAEGLASILGDARAVVNLLPLTSETEGLFRAETFEMMRPDALLVHLGRGAQLVERDLLAALDAGRPGHAALDVFETEPLPAGHPLWTHPKVTVTPHVAGDAKGQAAINFVAEGIAAFERGERPAGYVDRARGY